MKTKRKIGKLKGLAAAVGGAAVILSGCASTYTALPEPAKKVVRGTPGILWPITWRDAVKDEERQKASEYNTNENRGNVTMTPEETDEWLNAGPGTYNSIEEVREALRRKKEAGYN